MKLKGYIGVNVVTAGLEAITIPQQVAVCNIDAVLDAGVLNAADRALLKVEGQTGAILVCKSISDSPCEVEESFEQVLTLIKEASE